MSVYRVTVAEAPTPILYPAGLILVGAGEKQGTLGDETFVYNASHYLFVGSPLPMLCRTLASTRAPVFSMVVNIEMDLLRELLLELDALPSSGPVRPARSVFRARLAAELEDAGRRLLVHLASERGARALARSTIKEMLFHVLEGPYRESLRALAQGPWSQLGQVLRHMSDRYSERLRVGELARMAHMSIPTFHQHFKAMTATSPLQYLKVLRLTRARQLLQAGGSVKEVAHGVGYLSESQFSRDFRRFFGSPPSMTHSRRAALAPRAMSSPSKTRDAGSELAQA